MPDPNTPNPSSAALRQRLYRQRKRSLVPGGRRIPCESEGCPRRHTGTHGLLCWECARKTPEGRAKVARLVWELRQRKKAKRKGDNP